LKAVADAQHQTAALGKLHHPAHDRRKARHGAAAQVIAIGKPAGQDQTVESARKLVFVPEKFYALAHLVLETIENILIVARAGKNDDTPTHKNKPLPISFEP
jgi:hypothetical protein